MRVLQYVVEPEATPSGALTDLADRFRDPEQVHALDETGEDDLSGPYLVRYNSDVYWTIFVVQSDAFEAENETTEQTEDFSSNLLESFSIQHKSVRSHDYERQALVADDRRFPEKRGIERGRKMSCSGVGRRRSETRGCHS